MEYGLIIGNIQGAKCFCTLEKSDEVDIAYLNLVNVTKENINSENEVKDAKLRIEENNIKNEDNYNNQNENKENVKNIEENNINNESVVLSKGFRNIMIDQR